MKRRIADINAANLILNNIKKNITCTSYAGLALAISSFKCNLCGFEWRTNLENIILRSGCPKCVQKRITTLEEANEILTKQERNIVCINYGGSTKKFSLFKCLLDGFEWKAKLFEIKRGRGCPLCASSQGERRIDKFLTANNIKHIHNHQFEDCKIKTYLRFDFWLPDFNTIIEFDGEQHFEPVDFGNEKNDRPEKEYQGYLIRDRAKNNFCKSKGINLIRIPYTEIKNIEFILKPLSDYSNQVKKNAG